MFLFIKKPSDGEDSLEGLEIITVAAKTQDEALENFLGSPTDISDEEFAYERFSFIFYMLGDLENSGQMNQFAEAEKLYDMINSQDFYDFDLEDIPIMQRLLNDQEFRMLAQKVLSGENREGDYSLPPNLYHIYDNTSYLKKNWSRSRATELSTNNDTKKLRLMWEQYCEIKEDIEDYKRAELVGMAQALGIKTTAKRKKALCEDIAKMLVIAEKTGSHSAMLQPYLEE